MMKGMKGRFLRKLKSISTITSLRQALVFQENFDKEQAEGNNNPKGVSEPVNQVTDGKEIDVWGKENLGPFMESKEEISIPLEHGSTDGCTVPLPEVQVLKAAETDDFEPCPLLKNEDFEDFDMVVMEGKSTDEAKEESEKFLTLMDFEEKCPPGGSEQVILYTTSLKGIRKTFEDCKYIRFLLESFRVIFHERDVSMHLEFREELWGVMGSRVFPPRLFIRGRHIGGSDEVVVLHEQGRLRRLLHGLPLNRSTSPCGGCGGVGFVVCFKCNGSRKVVSGELTAKLTVRCLECNENGLIMCPICC